MEVKASDASAKTLTKLAVITYPKITESWKSHLPSHCMNVLVQQTYNSDFRVYSPQKNIIQYEENLNTEHAQSSCNNIMTFRINNIGSMHK